MPVLDGQDAGHSYSILPYVEQESLFRQLLSSNGHPIPDPPPDIVVVGEPVVPGPAVDTQFLIGDPVVANPSPGARESQDAAMQEIWKQAFALIGELARTGDANGDGDLVQAIRGGGLPTIDETLARFDVDDSGDFDATEVFGRHGDDILIGGTTSHDEIGAALGRFLDVVRAELGLGAGDEDLGFVVDDCCFNGSQTAALIYTYDAVGNVARMSGNNPNVSAKLGQLAQGAGQAQAIGDLPKENMLANQLARILGLARYRVLTGREADGLDTAVGVARTQAP
jgi:hypothetical protein